MHSAFGKILWVAGVAAWLAAGAGPVSHGATCPHADPAQHGAPAPADPGAHSGHHAPPHGTPSDDEAPQPCECPASWCCPATLPATPVGAAPDLTVPVVVASVAGVPPTTSLPPRPSLFAVPVSQPPPRLL